MRRSDLAEEPPEASPIVGRLRSRRSDGSEELPEDFVARCCFRFCLAYGVSAVVVYTQKYVLQTTEGHSRVLEIDCEAVTELRSEPDLHYGRRAPRFRGIPRKNATDWPPCAAQVVYCGIPAIMPSLVVRDLDCLP